MSDIFMLNRGSGSNAGHGQFMAADTTKIDLDDLYANNRNLYEKKRVIYERVLKLAHKTIQSCAKETPDKKYCWYEIPDIIWGVPLYDVAECTGFIYTELTNNNFKVRYVHPNNLFIVWQHWVPAYLRQELKTRHGVNINSFGEIIEEVDTDDPDNPTADAIAKSPHTGAFMPPNGNTGMQSRKSALKFKPVDSYKPKGIYNDELLNKLSNKIGR